MSSPNNTSLKIGVYGIRTIPSTYSGYETFCNVLLPELVQRGHAVTLFTRESGRQEYEGVKKIGLPSINTKQFDTLSHSVVCAFVSRMKRFDVVLTFNVANAISLAMLRFTGTPTVLNVDGQEWKRGKWGKLARSVFYNSGKISKYTGTRLITDCNEMGRIYKEEFNAITDVIPYCWTGLLTERELDKPNPKYLSQYDLTADQFLVTGGRLVPENNIAEIVESHVNSDEEMPIAVLGKANYDSPVQRKLDSLASSDSRVRLLGHISDRRGFGLLLRDSFAYLHGHSVGGINPSVVEAMGVGAFVCAFDTPFNREALGDAGTFFANPSTAVRELCDIVQTTNRDRKRLRGRELTAENYSLDKIVSLYEESLQRAVLR